MASSRRWARDSELTANMEGKVDPEYLAEVERMTETRVSRFNKAQRALQAAEARHAKAVRFAEEATGKRDRTAAAKRVAVAWELVEIRRQELQVIERLMSSAPASATHRGDRSYRQVPVRHGGNL